MIKENGFLGFGYWEGMPYGGEPSDKFEDFKRYKNSISKERVIEHIKSLSPALCPMPQHYDIFTGEVITIAGQYRDGQFVFPLDFLRYYEKYDIGIPPEYEEYLKSLGIG